jgi:hypothetical protein
LRRLVLVPRTAGLLKRFDRRVTSFLGSFEATLRVG